MNENLNKWWKRSNSAKVAGVLGGLAFGLFMAIFGFWKALVIAAFAAVGLLLGVLIDSNEELKSALGRLLGIGKGTEDEEDE